MKMMIAFEDLMVGITDKFQVMINEAFVDREQDDAGCRMQDAGCRIFAISPFRYFAT